MHLAAPQRPYPSTINHTPRGFDTLLPIVCPRPARPPLLSPLLQPDSLFLAEQMFPLPMPAAAASSAHTVANSLSSGTTCVSHGNLSATTREQHAAALPAATAPQVSQRYSWASFHCSSSADLAASLFAAPPCLTQARKEAETRLPASGTTLDMAYFLRNTGPPTNSSVEGGSGGAAAARHSFAAPKRSLANGLFKRRRDGSMGSS